MENSTKGLDREITFIKEISEKSGVHVVAGAGRNDIRYIRLMYRCCKLM